MLPIPKTSRLSQTRLNKFKVVFKQPNKRRNLLEHEPLYQPPRICPEQHRSTERRMNTRNACARLHMPKIGCRVAGHLPVASIGEEASSPPNELPRQFSCSLHQLRASVWPGSIRSGSSSIGSRIHRARSRGREQELIQKTMHVAIANQPTTD